MPIRITNALLSQVSGSECHAVSCRDSLSLARPAAFIGLM